MIDIVEDVKLPFNDTPLLLVNQKANNTNEQKRNEMDTYSKLFRYPIVEIEIPAILGRMKLNVTFLSDGSKSVWKSNNFFKVQVEFSVIKGENQPEP